MFSSLLELLDKLPRPDIDLPLGASLQDILSFETHYKLHLPNSMREFLQVINGAYVGSQVFLGINSTTNNEIGRFLELIPSWVQRNWIPIASDGCGNYFVMMVANEQNQPIGFIDHETGYETVDYVVSSRLEIFVEQFILREVDGTRKLKNWFFDEKIALQIDPNILKFKDLGLPWIK
ncbi:MAG: hypothetical protein RLZZ156_840 [Deinococcota bacterium]|jgi:cell wall assembly regulator SMI1